jgi:hypothetical protein
MPRDSWVPRPEEADRFYQVYVDESSQTKHRYLVMGALCVPVAYSAAFDADIIAHRDHTVPLLRPDGSTSIANIAPILRQNIRRESGLMTDEVRHYMEPGREFASHDAVNHTDKEYVRMEYPLTGDPAKTITTNTVEGYYSIFKRGLKGVYQHCAEKHLHRYLSEFDFRYSNRVALGVDDQDRAEKALKGITGKRLTYRGPSSFEAPF